MVIIFAKKSYTAGKFIGETEQSTSSEEVMEVDMKSTKNVESSPSRVAEKSSLSSVVVLNFSKL